MKGSRRKTTLIMAMLILIALIASLLVANRYLYGSFNPFSSPVRIVYGGFHYNHRSLSAIRLKGKTTIEISRIFDVITGKRFFSTDKDFIGPGKTIYLHLEGDNYISYSSGGGS